MDASYKNSERHPCAPNSIFYVQNLVHIRNWFLLFAIVLSNLWIAYGFIQTVLERRPGDVHRLVRVVIEFQQVREQKGLCYPSTYGTCHDNTGYFASTPARVRPRTGAGHHFAVIRGVRPSTASPRPSLDRPGAVHANAHGAGVRPVLHEQPPGAGARCWTRTPSSLPAPRFGAGGFSVPTLPSPGGRCSGGG